MVQSPLLKEYDAIVLHTAGMDPLDARISGWKPNLDAHIRTKAAAMVYGMQVVQHKEPHMVISGGRIHGPDNPPLSPILEEEIVRKYDINPKRIWLEDESVDTVENVVFSTELIKNAGLGERVAFVTSGYHVPRTQKIYDRHAEDLEVTGFSAEEVILDEEGLFVPEAGKDRLDEAILRYTSSETYHGKD